MTSWGKREKDVTGSGSHEVSTNLSRVVLTDCFESIWNNFSPKFGRNNFLLFDDLMKAPWRTRVTFSLYQFFIRKRRNSWKSCKHWVSRVKSITSSDAITLFDISRYRPQQHTTEQLNSDIESVSYMSSCIIKFCLKHLYVPIFQSDDD